MNLSDVWVVKVVQSNLSQADRTLWHPAVFNVKSLQSAYVHKGQPAKGYDFLTKTWKYYTIFGVHNMFGAEGLAVNMPFFLAEQKSNDGHDTPLNLITQSQSCDYDFAAPSAIHFHFLIDLYDHLSSCLS